MVCFVYGGGKGGGRILEIFSIFTQVSKGAVAKDSVRFRNTAVACFTSFLGRFGGNGSTAFPRPYLLVEGDCLVKISCQLGTLATLASRSSCYPFPGVHRCLNEGAGDMVSRGWCRCWYSSVGWAGKPTRWSVRARYDLDFQTSPLDLYQLQVELHHNRESLLRDCETHSD